MQCCAATLEVISHRTRFRDVIDQLRLLRKSITDPMSVAEERYATDQSRHIYTHTHPKHGLLLAAREIATLVGVPDAPHTASAQSFRAVLKASGDSVWGGITTI